MSTLFLRQSLKLLNALDLIVLSIVMLVTFFLQFYLNELPCPLCLLERIGLIAIGFGFLLNLHYRPRPGHYMFSLLAAIVTSFVALRQISLHIVPGSGSYGSALFGLHLYTWVFIACNFAIVYISIILGIRTQYTQLMQTEEAIEEPKVRWQKVLCHFAYALFFVLVIANAVSVFLECGLTECPDNPTSYVWKL